MVSGKTASESPSAGLKFGAKTSAPNIDEEITSKFMTRLHSEYLMGMFMLVFFPANLIWNFFTAITNIGD